MTESMPFGRHQDRTKPKYYPLAGFFSRTKPQVAPPAKSILHRKTIPSATIPTKTNKVIKPINTRTSGLKHQRRTPVTFKAKEATGKAKALDGLSASLEETRHKIELKCANDLNDAHSILDQHLSDATLAFEEKCQVSEKKLLDVLRPISEDRLILQPHGGGNNTNDRKEYVLGQRMVEFREIIADEEGKIDRLWKTWTALQMKIVALGVEVLGPEALEDGFDDKHTFRQMFQGAIRANGQIQEDESQLHASVDRVRKGAETVNRKLLKDSRDMEKQFEAEKKRQFQLLRLQIADGFGKL